MKFKKILFFCFSFIFFSLCVHAQQVTVQGTIVDESGLPLPGVTISLNDNTKTTVSDFDGKYTIKSLPSNILVFTFLGYQKQSEEINSRTIINITLQPSSQELEEIVVVGYGTQKKSVVTGSISSVKAKDLENLPITRIEQSLQGRTSGVMIASNSGQPGSSSTIRVRGITTFGNNEPLWVVDGVVVDAGGIGYLNQSDIESIEVLKDAASQAIYGARASTGVILVTTKKGSESKLSVKYSGYTGFSNAARKLDLLNATQYATLINEASVAANGNIIYPNPDALGKGTDWQSAIFNDDAQKQSHEVSISGGGKTSTFYASFGLIDQEGIVTPEISKYIRRNLRLNSTHKISQWLTFGQTLGYSNEKTVGLGNTNSEYGGPLSSAINLDPITKIVETDPAIIAGYPVNAVRDNFGNPYGISNSVGQEMTNPLAYVQTRLGNYGWADNFVGNAYLEAQPIEGLKFRTTLGAKLAYWGSRSFTPLFYLNSTNFSTQNSLSKNTNKGFGWNIENTISYTKSIDNHNFNILVGQGSYVDNITEGSGLTYFNLPVDNYRDASFNFNIPEDQKTSYASEGTRHIVTSLFARLNYDYKEKYLLTGIVRRDGSSRFGSNNKYGVFPSFSAGWVLTKEDFWKESKVLNTFKIRGGYGIVGSDAIGDFAYLSTIGGGRNYAFGTGGSYVVGYSPNAPSNPDLKWEETSQTNIGFEATLFNDFNLSFDWYKKVTTGILRNVPIPGYIGAISDPLGNVADMENEGFDLELGYKKRIGEFNLSFSGNVSYLKNKVTFIGDNIDYINGGGAFSGMPATTRIEVGHSYNDFYGYQTAGIFQNQAEVNAYTNASGGLIQPNAKPGDFRWVDIDGDGAITTEDRKYLGSPIPDFTYGFTINMNYKNFDLLIFAQGVAGNKIFQGVRRLDIANSNYQTAALDRWTGEGTSNSFPRLINGDPNGNFSKPSNFYLQNGDYLRLKTVQLGYSLPSDLLEKAKIQRVRLYVTAENLVTFTKYTGYDPEIGGGIMGIDKGQYPQARTIMYGINLEF